VRGPTQLKNFAVYTLKASTKKRSEPKSHKRHGHQHLHKKHHEEQEEKRAVGDVVTATIDGQVVTWLNEYTGEATTTAVAAAAAATYVKSSNTNTAVASTTTSGSVTAENYIPGGDYERVGYYSADTLEADGIAFLGNYGGQGSGCFDK
jgi:hypothetical protein